MENISRLVWITSPAIWKQEFRVREGLGAWRSVYAAIPDRDALFQFSFEVTDTVIFVPGGWTPQAQVVLTRVRELAGGARVLVRCAMKPGAIESQGCEILDPEEGPEILRARIARTVEINVEPTPQWRRLILGESRAIQRVVEMIRLVGDRRCTVLITGETGTGKEVAARAIHLAGSRSQGPFVAVNCSALPPALLEAELFGHTRGAFTGATQSRAGRFEAAHGGTLLLDEIGDMPMDLQAKLLRVLQEREFQRLGSSETVRFDVRVIAATNGDLPEKIRQGTFREDLFYRLNVVPLQLPPVRARGEDCALLIKHFLLKTCTEEDLAPKSIEAAAFRSLCEYSWPGNIRQLENSIAAAVILAGDRRVLYEEDFRLAPERSFEPVGQGIDVPEYGLDFEKAVSHFERSILSQALRKTNGNKKQAAEMLGLKRTTLSAKVRVLEMAENYSRA